MYTDEELTVRDICNGIMYCAETSIFGKKKSVDIYTVYIYIYIYIYIYSALYKYWNSKDKIALFAVESRNLSIYCI